jgi:hypothetical protein
MKKISITTLAAAVALSGGLTVLPTAPAFAQSGSRLCGFTAPTPAGTLGLLFEARQDDAAYSYICDQAVAKMQRTINTTPQLKSLTWTKHYKETCESVGGAFMSSNSPQDMCDKMEANQGYQVTKTNSSNSTAYVKQ